MVRQVDVLRKNAGRAEPDRPDIVMSACMATNGDWTDTVPLRLISLACGGSCIARCVNEPVAATNLEGEAEWTSLLGRQALCLSYGS